jgi:hypothetical protein
MTSGDFSQRAVLGYLFERHPTMLDVEELDKPTQWVG